MTLPEFYEDSVFDKISKALDDKTNLDHTHDVSEIVGFDAAVTSLVQDGINDLLDGAPTALDTLRELAAAIGNNASYAASVTTALGNKVDKVTGKQLSQEDFTSAMKTKLDALPVNAVLQSALNALDSRIGTIEAWKSLMKLARVEVFSTTTDANGDASIVTSTSFSSPRIFAQPHAAASALGCHTTISSVSGSTINLRVFKNKTQGVLIGGTIDPDEPLASARVDIMVTQAV